MNYSCSKKLPRALLAFHKNFASARYTLPYLDCRRFKGYESKLQSNTVRIGCASGFWGDTVTSTPQLIHGGDIDFLVYDYLSEITMSLLAAIKKKTNGAGGFTPDFVQMAVAPHIKHIKNKGIKVISNAGGVNPDACAEALKSVCMSHNVDLNIAVVKGDDIMHQVSDLKMTEVRDMDSGEILPGTVTSMNAYLGAGPISRALDLGADIVVTGRCVDSALVLAPLVHKFQWKWDDFEKMARGSLAGHLVECGAQVTGGIFTDWHTVPNWSNMGFPIIECDSTGNFVVTKPPKTGGLVTTATVAEQLLYELGDPSCYQLPDVACDFSRVQLEQMAGAEGDAVYVTGATGRPPSPHYKVSATYADGYRLTAVCCVGGPRAKDKALRTSQEIIKRCRGIFKQLKMADFSKVHTEILGSEHNYGPMSHLPQGSREHMLWLAAHHEDKRALELMSREIAPAGTGMAPGLTGLVGGRPKVSPVLKLFSFFLNKDKFKIDILMNGEHIETYQPGTVPTMEHETSGSTASSQEHCRELPRGTYTYRLEDLAYTRSGDKGNNCNIGVIARHPALLPYIKQALTEEAVAGFFSHLIDETTTRPVVRYNCDGINAVNFVLHNSLGGGGIASLRSDPQGKAYGQMLLDFEIKDMPELATIIA